MTKLENPTPMRQLFVALQSGAKSPKAVLEIERLLRIEIACLAEEGVFAGARQIEKGDY